MRALEVLLEANVYNVEDVQKYVERFAERVKSPQGKRFFLKNTRRWLISDDGATYHVAAPAVSADAPQWAIQAQREGSLMVFKPTGELTTMLSHLVDYITQVETEQPPLLDRIVRLDPIAVSNMADEFYRRRMATAAVSQDEKGVETVLRFPDGSRWVNLTMEHCLADEGNAMGHCVATHWHLVNVGAEQVYSLRDNKNRSHVTVSVSGGKVSQAKSKGNEVVAPRYRDKLVDLLNELKLGKPAYGVVDLQNAQIVFDNGTWQKFDIEKIEPIEMSFGSVKYVPQMNYLLADIGSKTYRCAVSANYVSTAPAEVQPHLVEIANKLHLNLSNSTMHNLDIMQVNGRYVQFDPDLLPKTKLSVGAAASEPSSSRIFFFLGDRTLHFQYDIENKVLKQAGLTNKFDDTVVEALPEILEYASKVARKKFAGHGENFKLVPSTDLLYEHDLLMTKNGKLFRFNYDDFNGRTVNGYTFTADEDNLTARNAQDEWWLKLMYQTVMAGKLPFTLWQALMELDRKIHFCVKLPNTNDLDNLSRSQKVDVFNFLLRNNAKWKSHGMPLNYLRNLGLRNEIAYDPKRKEFFVYDDDKVIASGYYQDSFTVDADKTAIAPQTQFAQALFLQQSNIEELPEKLSVGRDLILTGTKVKKLGDHLKVGRVLSLTNSLVETLPEHLTVGGRSKARLDLRKSQIRSVPETITLLPDGQGNYPRIQHDGNVELPERLKPYEVVKGR